MARLVAIEWDSAQIRAVVGRTRGDEVVVEQAAAAELPRKEDDADVGPYLAGLLERLQVGKSEVLVAIGRANIELRKMQLPPAPDEELPDMVRFQAMRQFTAIGDDWPLDYVPLTRSESGVEVLAAALSPTIVQQIRTTCTSLELTPKCLVLRPFAAASLLARVQATAARCFLVVDVLATEADLFVVADGNIAFMRTVRLPDAEHGEAAVVAALVGEVRRTIGAAQSQFGGRRIESIVVFADEHHYAELRAAASSQLSLPIETLNPFAAVKLGGDLERRLPEQPGRFAPLLGMMLDAASETGHRIDFFHPRKRPAPKSERSKYLALIAVAAAVICLLTVTIKLQLNRMDREIVRLNQEIAQKKAGVDQANKQHRDLTEVEKFLSGNIPWLQELERLSAKVPPPRDAMVTAFSASVLDTGDANVRIDGVIRSQEHKLQLEEALRDDDHRVIGGDASQDTSRSDYQWRFAGTIQVKPIDPREQATTEVAQQPDAVDSPSDAATSTSEQPADNDSSGEQS